MGALRQSLKTTRMQAITADIDTGSIAATASLELVTADGLTVLAAVNLAAPPSSSVALSVLTLLGVPLNAVAAVTGTVGYARIKNRDAAIIIDQMVTGLLASAEVQLSTIALTIGQPVQITSGTITHG